MAGSCERARTLRVAVCNFLSYREHRFIRRILRHGATLRSPHTYVSRGRANLTHLFSSFIKSGARQIIGNLSSVSVILPSQMYQYVWSSLLVS